MKQSFWICFISNLSIIIILLPHGGLVDLSGGRPLPEDGGGDEEGSRWDVDEVERQEERVRHPDVEGEVDGLKGGKAQV